MMETAVRQLQALYVAWQEPASRRYYPVARLVAGVGNAHDLYEFVYIRGAEEAEKDGFQPFPAFGELRRTYRSTELFPFFSNRLMSPKRPDFPEYIQSLGLELNVDPMIILARSGGTRATDSIELFPAPVRADADAPFQTFFWMHGFRYLDAVQKARVLSLQPGEELIAAPQRDNLVDPNAIRLFAADGTVVGHLPWYLASEVVRFLTAGVKLHVFVERVDTHPAPTRQRLLCRLEARWPSDLQPFAGNTYRPIPSDATNLSN